MVLILITIIAFCLIVRKTTRQIVRASVCHAVDTTAWSGLRASQEVRNILGGEKRFQEDVKHLLEEETKKETKNGNK